MRRVHICREEPVHLPCDHDDEGVREEHGHDADLTHEAERSPAGERGQRQQRAERGGEQQVL
jgi:hypothetical protein